MASTHTSPPAVGQAYAPPVTTPAPLDADERLHVVDVVRGLALGFMVFIHFHQLLRVERTTGNAFLDAVDWTVGWGAWILVEEKAWGAFALLFGAGFALFLRRLEARGTPAVPLFLRRLAFLFAVGWVMERTLDFAILRQYAWWGLALLMVRKWPTRALLGLALASTMARPVVNGAFALYLHATGTAFRPMRISEVLPWIVPDTNLPLFILGLLAVRLGVVDAPLRHAPLVRRWMMAGFAAWAVYWTLDFALPKQLPIAMLRGPVTTLLGLANQQYLCLTYAGGALLVLAARPAWLARLAPVGAAGRMALTSYVLQAIVVWTLATPLGMKMHEYQYVPAALTLFAALAALGTWWMARFRYGPLEWAWRMATYRRREPLRREAPRRAEVMLLVAALALPGIAGAQSSAAVRDSSARDSTDERAALRMLATRDSAGRTKDALALGRWMLAAQPRNVRGLFRYGWALGYAWESARAESVFRHIIAADPGGTYAAWSHGELAYLARARGDLAAAVRHMEDGRREKPSDPYLPVGLATMLLSRSASGDVARARAILDTVIAAKPDARGFGALPARLLLAWAAREQGDTAVARAAFTAADSVLRAELGRVGEPAAYYLAASAALQRRRAAALEWLARAFREGGKRLYGGPDQHERWFARLEGDASYRALLAEARSRTRARRVEAGLEPRATSSRLPAPPPAPVRPAADTLHGVVVTDPYRWLERTSDTSVVAWMRAQRAHASTVLALAPGADAIRAELAAMDSLAPSGGVRRVFGAGAGIVFDRRVSGSTLPRIVRRDRPEGTDIAIVEPARLEALLGKGSQLVAWHLSPDARHLAMQVSAGGREIGMIRVLDVAAGTLLADSITGIYDFGGSTTPWRGDGRAFAFRTVREGMPLSQRETGMTVRLHELGRAVADDPVVFGTGVFDGIAYDPASWVEVSPGDRWAMAVVYAAAGSEVYVAPTAALDGARAVAHAGVGAPWRRVVGRDEGVARGGTRSAAATAATCSASARGRAAVGLWFADSGGAPRALDLVPPDPRERLLDVEATAVEARSADGTMVPMTIVAPRGMRRDGSHPAILSGYSSNGLSVGPYFIHWYAPWFTRGGVYVDCYARGGGERGIAWHLDGRAAHLANLVADWVACAEYLVRHRWSAPGRIAVAGTSAGGVPASAAAVARPDLFGAAWLEVPVTDLLRAEFEPNGAASRDEFGSVLDPALFRVMRSISAVENVRDGVRYPAFLISAGLNDRRVSASGAAKLAARLQAATASGRPVLLWVSEGAGHGGTGPHLSQALAFLLWQLGAPATAVAAAASAPLTPTR